MSTPAPHALSGEDRAHYEEHGFLLRPGVFTADEVESLTAAAELLYSVQSPATTLESDGSTVRATHGCHESSPVFASLVRDHRLLLLAQQLLGEQVYVHQSKINAKRALGGDSWPWHQDYVFWQREDGVPAPDLVNVALFLDEATHLNGPLLLIPGSHRMGTISPRRAHDGQDAGWKSHLAADLEYTVPVDVVAELTAARGIMPAVGAAGTLLFFHPEIVHGSGNNMAPADRRMAIFTYNSVANRPSGARRPDFLSSRDFTPLELLPEAAR